MCEDYHVLPSAGGLLDQDSLMIHFLLKVREFDSIRADFDDAQAKQGRQM
jgi:hypothetical protein